MTGDDSINDGQVLIVDWIGLDWIGLDWIGFMQFCSFVCASPFLCLFMSCHVMSCHGIKQQILAVRGHDTCTTKVTYIRRIRLLEPLSMPGIFRSAADL